MTEDPGGRVDGQEGVWSTHDALDYVAEGVGSMRGEYKNENK